jgi:hypothetical protein
MSHLMGLISTNHPILTSMSHLMRLISANPFSLHVALTWGPTSLSTLRGFDIEAPSAVQLIIIIICFVGPSTGFSVPTGLPPAMSSPSSFDAYVCDGYPSSQVFPLSFLNK